MERRVTSPRWRPPSPSPGIPVLAAAIVAGIGLGGLSAQPPRLLLGQHALARHASPVVPVDALGVAHHDFAYVEGRDVVLARLMYGSLKTVWKTRFPEDIALTGALDGNGTGFDDICLSARDSSGARALLLDRDGHKNLLLGPLHDGGARPGEALIVDDAITQAGRRKLLGRALRDAGDDGGAVVLFDLQSGHPEWVYRLSGEPGPIAVADLDGDGRPEFVLAVSPSPAEPAAASSVLALREDGTLLWQTPVAGGRSAAAAVALGPAARGAGMVAIASSWGIDPASRDSGRLVAIDGTTGRPIEQHAYPAGLGVPMSLGGSAPHVVVGSRDGWVRVFDTHLQMRAERRFDGPVEVRGCADINRDGSPEVVAATRREVLILDEGLRTRASLAVRAPGPQPVAVALASAGLGNARLVVSGPEATLADVQPVPPLRDPPRVAVVLGFAALMGLGTHWWRRPRRVAGLPGGSEAREFLLDYHQIRHETFGRERPFARVRLWAQAHVAGHALPAEVLESARDEFRRLGAPTLLRFARRAAELGVESGRVRGIEQLSRDVERTLEEACTANGGGTREKVEDALATMTELSEESLEAYREVALRDVCRPDYEAQEAILAKRAVLDRNGVGIRFEADAAGRQPVLFDSSELRALVGELLENAAKALAAAPDGEVTLTVSGKPGDARWVELQVTDNGPGIPRERREAMFAPDASSHPEGGFGLHRAREIAQRWLADLAIEDPPSRRGARIRLSLRTLLPHDVVAAGAVPSHPPAPEDA